jgi:mRNA interferase RelE/StbE
MRVATAIDKLVSEPRPPNAKLLIGMPGVRRIRIGDYRVLYTVDDDTSEVWVEDVRHRSKAYRRR